MAIISSFFNSVRGDRKYKAEDWAAYFGTLIGNGYFADRAESLKAIPGGGMSVNIRAGKAFVNGYFMWNTEDYVLPISVANGILPRIDRIVVRWSLVNRDITLAVKAGTPSSYPAAPALQRDTEVWELAIADVSVSAGALSITSENISDLRIDKNYCGAVTGMIDQIDTSDFVAQYNAMLDQLREALQNVQEGSAWVMKTGDTMTGPLVIDATSNSTAKSIVRRTMDAGTIELHSSIGEDGVASIVLYGPDNFATPTASIEIKNGSVRIWPELANIRYVSSASEIASVADKQVGDLFVVDAE